MFSDYVTYKYTNARYFDDAMTVIDMDLEHPKHGWIPISINEAEYPELWVEVVKSNPLPYSEQEI